MAHSKEPGLADEKRTILFALFKMPKWARFIIGSSLGMIVLVLIGNGLIILFFL